MVVVVVVVVVFILFKIAILSRVGRPGVRLSSNPPWIQTGGIQHPGARSREKKGFFFIFSY